MPDAVVLNYSTSLAQFGLLGIFAYVVVWFTRSGFPQVLEKGGTAIGDFGAALGPAIIAVTDRVLSKIDQIETDCSKERLLLLQMFREQINELARLFREQITEIQKQVREDRDFDRKARHEQGGLLQKAIVDYEEILQAATKQVEVALTKVK